MVRFYRREHECALNHSVKEIFRMFAFANANLSNMLEQDDFNPDELYIEDSDGDNIQ